VRRIRVLPIATGWVAVILVGAFGADHPTVGIQPELADKLKNLVRITSSPIKLRPNVNQLCLPSGGRKDHSIIVPPKIDAVAHVYVSPEGVSTMSRRDATAFPVGVLILKQKFEVGKLENPVLYTGMLKRESGFNPECGDWEFFTLSGDGKSVTARGRLESCMACHQEYKHTDFVTKHYPVER
jgi:Cytochrome P460